MKKVTLFMFVLAAMGLASLMAQPQPPTGLTAKVSVSQHGASVSLLWKDTLNTGSSTKYNVYRKTGTLSDTTAFKKIGSNLRSKSYSDRMVTLNATYCYKVTAVTSAGESGASNIVEAAVVPPAPVVPGVITGVITDAATNAAVPRAYINFFSMTNGEKWNITYADSQGSYKIKLAPGTYYLYTSGKNYVPEYYDNVATFQQATAITLNANDSLNYNVGLAAVVPPVTYTLSGSVKDAAGAPIKSFVTVYSVKSNSRYHHAKQIKVDSLGNFSTSLKENDTVVVYAAPLNRLDWYAEFYNNKTTINEADRIAISGNVTGIDIVLDHKPVYPNGLAGKIKDTTGAGVPGVVSVFPRRPAGHGEHHGMYTIHTDSLGNYAFTNLLPGQYIVLGVPTDNFKPSYFKYDGSSTMNWRLADSVVIDSASMVSAINVTVRPRPDSGFARITGLVRDSRRQPVNGAFVYAINPVGEIYGFGVTNANGQYIIDGLIQDDYTLVSDKLGYAASSSAASTNYFSAISNTVNFTLTPDGVTAVENEAMTVENYALYQNYPNPFNPSTTISYQLPSDARVSLKVYNILGSEVATLVNASQSAGKYNVTFDASKLTSGVYIYKLEAGNFSATKKLMLMK